MTPISTMLRKPALMFACAGTLAACAPSTREFEQKEPIARQFVVAENVRTLHARLLKNISSCYGRWDSLGQWNVANEISSDANRAKIFYYLTGPYTGDAIIFHIDISQKDAGSLVHIRRSFLLNDSSLARLEASAKTGSRIC